MHRTDIDREFKPLIITSTAFQNHATIPRKYTCEGANVNPPIDIAEIPNEVKSMALIVDDPDAPRGTWLHWLVWNIPFTHHINENEVPGTEGSNDFKNTSYGGPCPPSGTHRYFFRVYGLDDVIDLQRGAARKELESTMRNHILAYGEIVGHYKKGSVI